MKRIGIFLISVLIISLLAGCFPDGTKPLQAEISPGKTSVTDIENITLKLKLPEEYPPELSEIYAEMSRFSPQLVRRVFLDDLTPAEFNEEDTGGYYILENKDMTIFGEGSFYTAKGGEIPTSQRLIESYNGYIKLDSVFPEKELSFPAKEAEKRVESLLSELKITNFGVPEITAVTAERANEFLNSILDENTAPEWDTNDEIYIFEYPITLGDIPVSKNDFYFNENSFHNASGIHAVVSKDDIILLQIDNLYSSDYEQGDTVKINIQPERALDIALSHFSGVYLKDPIILTDIKLVYITAERNEIRKLSPIWELFYTEQTEKYDVPKSLLIDANTGRIF